MLQVIYVPFPGDEKVIRDYKESFSQMSTDELVEAYNKQARLGYVGVHRQVLYMLAMQREFIERFEVDIIEKDSSGMIFSMKSEVEVKDGKLFFLNKKDE
jgi:hypothetical protein